MDIVVQQRTTSFSHAKLPLVQTYIRTHARNVSKTTKITYYTHGTIGQRWFGWIANVARAPFYDVNDFSGAVSGPSAGFQVEKLIYSK